MIPLFSARLPDYASPERSEHQKGGCHEHECRGDPPAGRRLTLHSGSNAKDPSHNPNDERNEYYYQRHQTTVGTADKRNWREIQYDNRNRSDGREEDMLGECTHNRRLIFSARYNPQTPTGVAPAFRLVWGLEIAPGCPMNDVCFIRDQIENIKNRQ